MTIVFGVIIGVFLAVAYCAQMARWLRVLQREHYEPASMMRFLGRWSAPSRSKASSPTHARKVRPISLSHLFALLFIVAIILQAFELLAILSIIYGIFCPVGLSVKGRTGTLQWTRRLRTVALTATIVSIVIALAFLLFTTEPYVGGALMVLGVPPMLDIVTRALERSERRKANVFVEQAVRRLQRVAPRIVAITGSYGKTSTKNHLADLLGSDEGVVASPRSFNNRAGLSRSINENLADGTRVFIAEMGTYGPGEIRELTSWCTPEIAVVTAIGPVHLERMKTLDVIDAAKKEITEQAKTIVLNVDDVRLAAWVEGLKADGKHVVTAGSKNEHADVRLVSNGDVWELFVHGEHRGVVHEVVGVQVTNVACAVATALALDVDLWTMVERLQRIRPVANRLNVATADSGVLVIDDTFNANPESATAAINVLRSSSVSGRRVVVTPGLIELGSAQYSENTRMASRVAAFDMDLVVVGRTNVVPLEAGYERPVRRFDTRDEAVAWVRKKLVRGDGVLYLNDLPDHYP